MIDGKDVTKTKYEAAWELIAGGLLQGRNLESPGIMAEEGDYSHFARFLILGKPWPAHLPAPTSRNLSKPGAMTNLSMILYESLAFADSEKTIGLQLADIVTSAFRRAMMGRCQIHGYYNLGMLMRRVEKDPYEFHLFSSKPETVRPVLAEYDKPHMIIKSRVRMAGT